MCKWWKEVILISPCHIDPKDLNKAIIYENHKTPTLEEIAHVLTGATKFSTSGWQQSILLEVPGRGSFTPHNIQHTPQQVQISLCTIWTQNESGHFPDENGWLCIPMPRSIGHTWQCVHIWEGQQNHDANIIKLFSVAQKEGLIFFNSSKCSIKQDSVTFFGDIFSANGYSSDPEKIQGITEMTPPQMKQELQPFLGAVNYLQTFIPPPQSSHRTTTYTPLKGEQFCKGWEL